MSTAADRNRMRQLLSDWGDTERLIRLREDELKRMREEAEPSLSSPQLTGMPNGNTLSDPTYRCVEEREWFNRKYKERFEQIQREIDYASERERAVNIALRLLPVYQQQVIGMVYRMHMTYGQVGKELHCDERTAHRYEEAAVETLLSIAK